MAVASLNPSPPIEIGKSVIALIMGKNIKKYRSFIFRPNDKATTKKVRGAVIWIIKERIRFLIITFL